MKQTNKMVIYQVFPRWFGNKKSSLVKNGSKVENGVGKFSDFTPLALSKIKELGTTHVWYTGVIEHATNTDYTAYQIRKDHAAVVKGNAGSPYAIKDYYDIDPDLADRSQPCRPPVSFGCQDGVCGRSGTKRQYFEGFRSRQ